MRLFRRVVEGFFGCGSRGCHQEFHIRHGDDGEDEVADFFVVAADGAFEAARAFLKLQPHDDGAFHGGDFVGGFLCLGFAAAEGGYSHQAEEFEAPCVEFAACDASSFHVFAQCFTRFPGCQFRMDFSRAFPISFILLHDEKVWAACGGQ